MKRFLLIFSAVLLSLSGLKAQGTCTEQLTQAQLSFDDGLLDDIPGMLKDCMEQGFTKEEKTNAYKLLIQTYLFNQMPEKADEVMMEFLNEFPSYRIAVNDPKEFINLHSTYRTDPIFKVEARGGLAFLTPFISEYFGPNDISAIRPDYEINTGFHFELNYINTLSGNLNYSAGASFTLLRLGYNNIPYDYSQVNATLNHFYLGVPLALRYNYDLGGFLLFGSAGVEPVYLISSTASFTRTDDIVGEEPIRDNETLTPAHRRMDVRPFFTAGLNIDLGRDQLTFSLGYKFGTFNKLNPGELYSDLNLSTKYFYEDDDMLLHHGMVTLSYIRPIYQPKKIR